MDLPVHLPALPRPARRGRQWQSNNDQPDFTDEEVLTIHVFGLIKKRTTISKIHEYKEGYFSE
ncbi:hypothetical protein GGP61_003511 [Salinibacter ruber]|uniref:Uncharacterized protein n=1 Tax=Salinibacter ruber TaxID=146919 RepID=A0A9X2Q9F1_9BACT|nr:hypothetical protein [Salinibacter ruber]MCS3711876.1 hypothetical protein [Salinibacter ruber]